MFPGAHNNKKNAARRPALRCLSLLIAVCLHPSAFAQAASQGSYLFMSHSLAEQLGRTWQRGELCRVQLDGLSRRSADLLFSRRLQDPGLAKVMASYDEAVKRATGERCDRKVLDEEIRRSDSALRAYLQLAAPYRVEIGPSQGPRPY